MPIPVECPGCGARLNAPDAGAGKKVRCPKPDCGSLIPVPALIPTEEVVGAEPAPPPPRDEDDDRPRTRRRASEDRPRKRRRDEDDRRRHDRHQPRRKRGMGTPAIVAIILGSVLVLTGIGYGVYAALGGKAVTSPPPGWNEYVYADSGIKAYFPTEPRRLMDDSPGRLDDTGGRGLMFEYTAHSVENGSAMTAVVYTRRIPPHISPAKARELINQEFENPARFPIVGLRLIDSRTVTWMGHQVKEFRLQPENAKRDKDVVMVQRCVVTDTHEIHAEIAMEDGSRLTSRLINGFFDNVQQLK